MTYLRFLEPLTGQWSPWHKVAATAAVCGVALPQRDGPRVQRAHLPGYGAAICEGCVEG